MRALVLVVVTLQDQVDVVGGEQLEPGVAHPLVGPVQAGGEGRLVHHHDDEVAGLVLVGRSQRLGGPRLLPALGVADVGGDLGVHVVVVEADELHRAVAEAVPASLPLAVPVDGQREAVAVGVVAQRTPRVAGAEAGHADALDLDLVVADRGHHRAGRRVLLVAAEPFVPHVLVAVGVGGVATDQVEGGIEAVGQVAVARRLERRLLVGALGDRLQGRRVEVLDLRQVAAEEVGALVGEGRERERRAGGRSGAVAEPLAPDGVAVADPVAVVRGRQQVVDADVVEVARVPLVLDGRGRQSLFTELQEGGCHGGRGHPRERGLRGGVGPELGMDLLDGCLLCMGQLPPEERAGSGEGSHGRAATHEVSTGHEGAMWVLHDGGRR